MNDKENILVHMKYLSSSLFTTEIFLELWIGYIMSTIMLIIFWDFLMVEQIFFHHKWKEAWLLVIKWYIRVTSRITERITDYHLRKLEKIRKISKPYRILPSAQSPSQIDNFGSTSKNLAKSRNWTFPVVRYFTWKLEFEIFCE